MPQTNITNLPGVTANLETQINLATALEKAIAPFHIFNFMTNRNEQNQDYKTAPTKGANVNISIKPVLTEEAEETSYDGATELTLADFETASWGKINVPLDYAATKKFGLQSPSVDMSPFEFLTHEQALMQSAFKNSIIPRMFKTINGRLRTASLATTVGATGTAINIGVFNDLRNAFDDQGYEDERIEVRVHKDFYDAITLLPEFQNIRGTLPTVGNNMAENTTISNTKFSVEGKYKMDFIKDMYYLRPTPGSDPIFSATIDTSAVVPFRGLGMTDETTQTNVVEPTTGLMFRYDKSYYKTNIGETLGGRIQAYYGFAELSGDINTSGVVQSVPIVNGLGGKA